MTWFAIAVGGALGTLMRYGVTLLLAEQTLRSGFPLGTLAANVVGSFLLGLVMELAHGVEWLGVDVRLVLGVGVLGGFTTYSSFNLETIRLAEQGHGLRAAGYAGLTLLVCLAAGLAAVTIARRLRPS